MLVAGRNVGEAAAAAAKLAGVRKVLVADDAAYEHGLAEPLAALLVALAPEYDAILSPRERLRQERAAARRRRCSTSRRSPTSPRSSAPTPSCGRSTPATRSRR